MDQSALPSANPQPSAREKRIRSDTLRLAGITRAAGSPRGILMMRNDSGVYRLQNRGGGEGRGMGEKEREQKKNPLQRLILKMINLSEEDEVTAFTVEPPSCTLGRSKENTLSVPADIEMANNQHAVIFYEDGHFYIKDCEHESGTYVRISNWAAGDNSKDWPLYPGSVFRVGSSELKVIEVDDGTIHISAEDGKLSGQRLSFNQERISIGRSADNLLHLADSELSRHHAALEFNREDGNFYLVDLGSTNGTYIRLTGPYATPYRLFAGDQVMVSRTSFSVNRFNFGCFSDIGLRQTMEDVHASIQDLNISELEPFNLFPQSFFAVYDGHGGNQAADFVGTHLHYDMKAAIKDELRTVDASASSDDVDARLRNAIVKAFEATDRKFYGSGDRPRSGTTATVALILANRLYTINLGDSRMVLCRDGMAMRLTDDHKPTREDEARRIREAGGFVINSRVMGELAISRAFGDFEFKNYEQAPKPESKLAEGGEVNGKAAEIRASSGPLITCLPDIAALDLTPQDKFLLLACDGLFDVFTNQEAVDLIRKELDLHGDVDRACQAIAEVAINSRGSKDNVTVLVILLNEVADKMNVEG